MPLATLVRREALGPVGAGGGTDPEDQRGQLDLGAGREEQAALGLQAEQVGNGHMQDSYQYQLVYHSNFLDTYISLVHIV